MIAGGDVNGKLCAKKMEGNDNLRTLERLRGRLVAQRAASRLAKEDAEQMRNKLTELENKLREEINSRNRAEKSLNSLMKKLESLNLSYVSENSENSIILGKSDMSSVSSSSSTASLATQKVVEAKQFKNQITNCATEESKTKSPTTISQDLEYNASQTTSSSQTHFSPAEEDLISEEKSYFDDSTQSYHNPKKEYLSSSNTSDEALNDYVDNLRALVPVDLPKESQPSDMLKANVVDVLDALRHAREKLELSIEKRQMIEVGSK